MLSKKTISLLLKIGIVSCALFFSYQQFTEKSSIPNLNYKDILNNIELEFFTIILVLFMMFLNWSLEALKWKFLIKKIETISFMRSIRAVFSGITVSTFTPNRVGEYGGRIFCLKEGDRIQAVLITVIGSIAQLLVTVIFGSLGICFLPKLIPDFSYMVSSIQLPYFIVLFFLFSLNILLLIMFLKFSALSKLLSQIKFLKKYQKYNTVFSFYSSKELIIVLLFSIARYIVFTTQFLILLYLFGIGAHYTDTIILIMVMLFVISIIPTIAITEIGVRASVSVFLFGLVSDNITGIISATFLIWVINLLLPALIGTIFIFTLKFFRK